MYTHVVVKLRDKDWKRYRLFRQHTEDEVYDFMSNLNLEGILSIKVVQRHEDALRTPYPVIVVLKLEEIEELNFT